MNLDQFLSEGASAAEFAKQLGVPAALVSQWRHGARKIPASRCPAIERATNGAVRCEDLRPDIDWAYLRGTAPVNDAIMPNKAGDCCGENSVNHPGQMPLAAE